MKNLFCTSALQLVLSSLLFSVFNAAQAAVMLTGGLSHEYNLQPGGSVSGVLELRNAGKEYAEVKIYQEDVRISPQGKPEFVPGTGGHARSNANWIDLEKDRVVLAPGARQKIAYTLNVPQHNVKPGSYWSSLMLEPIAKQSAESRLYPQDPNKPDIKIQQTVRYAVRVLTDIGNQGGADLSIEPPRIEKSAAGERWFSVDIRNQGNRFTRPNVWLDVFDQQGIKIGKFTAQPHAMYAGEKENFRINIAGLRAGSYKGLLAAEDNRSGQVFGSDIKLNIKP